MRVMTLKIAVTGSRGFLGWHMLAYLASLPDTATTAIDRTVFDNSTQLAAALHDTDIIFHFAAVNRGSDEEVATVNPALAQALARALDDAPAITGIAKPVLPVIVHSSSIQAGNGSTYGQSKKAASEILHTFCEKKGFPFIDLILPHIFGEHGRPDYNSVVSTFCHRLANGQKLSVENDGEIEPVHAQRVCEEVLRLARTARSTTKCASHRIAGTVMRVSTMAQRLEMLASQYGDHVIPDLRDPVDLDLFNTYRSYLYPQHFPQYVERHTDERGWLAETVRGINGGQTFVSETNPGHTRGNHFHRHKFERFFVVAGKAEISIRRIGYSGVETFVVSGDKPCYIDMPTLHTHSITNVGSGPLLTQFWANEIFDPRNPDTYFEPVSPRTIEIGQPL